MKHVSPALGRALGMTFFLLFGLGSLHLGNKIFGLDIEFYKYPITELKLGIGGVVLIICSIVIGLIGMLIGWGIALNTEVRSEKANYTITVIWQYSANGVVLWCLMWVLCLTKILGKEGSKEFIKQIGAFSLGLYLIGVSVSGCLLIAGSLFLTGQLRDGVRPKLTTCLLPSVPIAMGMGYLQSQLLEINTNAWIIISVVLPFLLVPFSAFMIERDKRERFKIMEMK
jgi:hypothetical protein